MINVQLITDIKTYFNKSALKPIKTFNNLFIHTLIKTLAKTIKRQKKNYSP